ncbi:MAG TPA: LysR substrate-binding domain-containing protein [Pseudolabrys sp.]|jgi:DNA-binding transcriptional LysR family regulator|nr:LysR substrate-binding domain-containing protein [Pseudolabrys sp.]
MVRNLDIDLLRSFVVIVELKSFTRAATTIGRSQSAISMQIKALEDAVGQPLLDRSPQHIALTRAGEDFLGYARRILDLHDEALGFLNAKKLQGTVKIAVMDDFATFILPGTLSHFARTHPDVELEITTGFTRDLLQELGSKYDLVLATQQAGTGAGMVLRTERTSWAFSDRHLVPSQDPIPLALLRSGNMFREWALDSLTAQGRTWRIVLSSTSIGAVEAAAAAGMAITVVKERTARAGLRMLGEAEGLPPLPVSEIALHIAPGKISAAARGLAEYLISELKE